MMLFLRKLSRIVVQTPSCNMSIQRMGELPNLKVKVETTGRAAELRHFKVHKERYVVPRAVREGEQKRGTCQTFEILLAFPLTESGTPLINVLGKGRKTNSVFAFLPVRPFGFRFIIQAASAHIDAAPAT